MGYGKQPAVHNNSKHKDDTKRSSNYDERYYGNNSYGKRDERPRQTDSRPSNSDADRYYGKNGYGGQDYGARQSGASSFYDSRYYQSSGR